MGILLSHFASPFDVRGMFIAEATIESDADAPANAWKAIFEIVARDAAQGIRDLPRPPQRPVPNCNWNNGNVCCEGEIC